MKIICAGLGKTGTKSITKVLRHLGFIVFDWEEQTFDFLDHWVDVFKSGAQPDVKRVYQNADAVVNESQILLFYPRQNIDKKKPAKRKEKDNSVRPKYREVTFLMAFFAINVNKSFVSKM